MISYKKIIIAAAQIVLSSKYLWFFGLFAAFLSGGIYGKIYGSESSLLKNWRQLKETGIFDFNVFSRIAEVAAQDPAGTVWRLLILLAVIALGIFIFWLAVVSRGALVNNVAKLYLGKRTDFKEGVDKGKAHFWPVCFLKLLERVVIFLLFAALSIPWLLRQYYFGGSLARSIYYAAFILALAISSLAVLIARYSIFYNIIKGERFIDAVKSAVTLLKNRFWLSIEAGIVFLAANFLLSLFILIFISAIAIPFVFLMFLFYKLAFAAGLTFILFSGILVLFALIGVAGGALSSFNESFWVILFIILNKSNPKSFINFIYDRWFSVN